MAAWSDQVALVTGDRGIGRATALLLAKRGAVVCVNYTAHVNAAEADIRGIGFKTADAIAMKLGIEKTAMVRVRAGISYALTEAMDEGHCGLPTDELVPLAEKLLDVPQRSIAQAIITSKRRRCASLSIW